MAQVEETATTKAQRQGSQAAGRWLEAGECAGKKLAGSGLQTMVGLRGQTPHLA